MEQHKNHLEVPKHPIHARKTSMGETHVPQTLQKTFNKNKHSVSNLGDYRDLPKANSIVNLH